MIITKKEFKDAVKKIIVDGISNTRQENVTEEKNAETDKKVATVLTDYYEKVIRNIFRGENWTYSKDELANVSALVLNDRFSDNPEPLVFMENLACIASTRLLINILEEKRQEEEPQEKEFDVEEILREAGSEQE
mgnify:CR=1 FL=1|jgi:hypothetical protein|nr:MAG TPA: hypothetical protein [Caudoviricetes sp.]